MNHACERWATLAAAAGLVLLAACSEEPSTTSSSDPASESASAEPDYVLLLDDDADPDQVQGEPGRYALTARGDGTPPLAVLDVPAGFSNFGFFALWPSGSAEETGANADPYRAVQYWTVDGVFFDPCDRQGKPARDAGTSVDDLAAALVAQKLTSTSKPAPVSLDGHDGLYLEMMASPDVEFDDCEIGYYFFWEGMPGDAQHSADSPGTVERTWIIDVDGERVVLVAASAPGVSHTQVEALTHMVESVQFVEP